MQRSESIAALAAALAKAQGALKPAVKDATNPHFKSSYADLASCWEACREPLSSNGIAVVQIPRASEHEEIVLETVLLHSSGEWISDAFALPVSKGDAQGYGSALTYARRYGLCAMVGIAPDDDDGNAATKAPPAQRRATPPTSRPQPGAEVEHAAPKRDELLARIAQREASLPPDVANAVYVSTLGDQITLDECNDADLIRYGVALKLAAERKAAA